MDKEKIKKIENYRKIILNRIKLLQTLKRKEYILKLARTGEESLAICGDEWDKQAMLLGALNGIVDLETGILRPGNPTDYKRSLPLRCSTVWTSPHQFGEVFIGYFQQ
jgi:phage/plasmid-associated DNA primase